MRWPTSAARRDRPRLRRPFAWFHCIPSMRSLAAPRLLPLLYEPRRPRLRGRRRRGSNASLPLFGTARDWFDVDDGAAIDGFDWADQHPVLLDAPDGDLVQAKRVWPVR